MFSSRSILPIREKVRKLGSTESCGPYVAASKKRSLETHSRIGNLVHQRNIRSYEIGIVVVDIHPVVPSHLERHIGRISSVLSVAASEQGTVVVREDEIVTPSL